MSREKEPLDTRMDSFIDRYEILKSNAHQASGTERDLLFNRLRRTRRLLAKWTGIYLHDGGNESPISWSVGRKQEPLRQTPDQKKTAVIEDYIQQHGLHYGETPSNNETSWTLGLEGFRLTEEQMGFVKDDLPEIIGDFHFASMKLMEMAFDKGMRSQSPPLEKVYRVLTQGKDPRAIQLWEEALVRGQQPASTRPDIVIARNGMDVIEYNVDGGADKGNTAGVNAYSKLILQPGERIVGKGLINLFLENTQQIVGEHGVVATIIPGGYREEYVAQNRYFANLASQLGEGFGIRWVVAKTSQVRIESDGVYLGDDRVDIIDREFKLPGFVKGVSFKEEETIIKAWLEGKVKMFGTILPFQDKAFFAFLFDKELEEFWVSFLGEERFRRTQAVHAESQLVSSEKEGINFEGQFYSWETTKRKGLPFGLVLKRTGDDEKTTGSKGLVISTDVGYVDWASAVDKALEEMSEGGNYWIIQRFHESGRFPVKYIRNSLSLPKNSEVAIRFAPYYVRLGREFVLGNILVTAGTDEETRRKELNNIHGLRGNTYLAVVTTKEE